MDVNKIYLIGADVVIVVWKQSTINETYVDDLTDRVVCRCRHRDDLRVVPYNLQIMMDWNSHINIE